MPLDPTLSSFLGAIIGSLAGVSGAVLTSVIVKRSEERRHYREIIDRTNAPGTRKP
jgi:hypothetical protein